MMGIVSTGNINQFDFRGTGTDINSPYFRLPTSSTCIVGIHIEGIADSIAAETGSYSHFSAQGGFEMRNNIIASSSLAETYGSGDYKPSEYIIVGVGSNNTFKIKFINTIKMDLSCNINFTVINKPSS